MTKTIERKRYGYLSPLLDPRERALIWGKVRGMWKHRKPDPIVELKKMRREWERPLPSLK